METTTKRALQDNYRCLGHLMRFGDWIIGTNKVWNDETKAYDHFAALYQETADANRVVKTLESDEAFSDEGHATAWAISMAAEYEAN